MTAIAFKETNHKAQEVKHERYFMWTRQNNVPKNSKLFIIIIKRRETWLTQSVTNSDLQQDNSCALTIDGQCSCCTCLIRTLWSGQYSCRDRAGPSPPTLPLDPGIELCRPSRRWEDPSLPRIFVQWQHTIVHYLLFFSPIFVVVFCSVLVPKSTECYRDVNLILCLVQCLYLLIFRIASLDVRS